MYEEDKPINTSELKLLHTLLDRDLDAGWLMNICRMNEGMWVRVELGMLIRKAKSEKNNSN
jgi:hypothetical protein